MAKKWTILVYLSGDNNLAENGVDDINEMAKVGSNDNLNIVAQFDRAGKWGTRRFYVTKNGGYDKDVVQDLGETNAGDPKVLEDFLIWGIKKYPAQHYMLILWGHGSGWLDEDIQNMALKFSTGKKGITSSERDKIFERGNSGIKGSLFSTSVKEIVKLPEVLRLQAYGNDDGSSDFLDMVELKKVLSSGLKKTKLKKFDIIGFDACLMNMLEVSYQIKDSARILVGSEEEEPGRGWPYDKILGAIAQKPDMTPTEIAELTVNEYVKSYDTAEEKTVTQATVNLEKIKTIKDKVDGLADTLIAEMKNKDVVKEVTISYTDDTKLYSYYQFMDLYAFAKLLGEKSSNAKIKSSTEELAKALEVSENGYVLASKKLNREKEKAAHGVSIYFPQRFMYSPFYDKLDISKKGKWNKFIKTYQEKYNES